MIRALKVTVATIVLGALAVGCRQSDPPTPSPPQPRDDWNELAAGGSNEVRLLLLDTAKDATHQSAQEVWHNLLRDLAADSESQKLLQQLNAGMAVELVVLEGSAPFNFEAVKQARPRENFSVRFTLHGKQPGEWVAKEGALYGILSYGRFFRLKKGDPRLPASVVEAVESGPEMIYLVTNDHLLRRSKGWQFVLVDGPKVSPDYITKRKNASVELRAEVDRRVAEFLKRHQPKQ